VQHHQAHADHAVAHHCYYQSLHKEWVGSFFFWGGGWKNRLLQNVGKL
jgi:hypothetical protein